MEQTETLEIVTVEKASEKELVKVNPLKIQLNELKEKYKDADKKELSPKERYELWKEAVADFRTHKTTTEKKRKEHKSFFLEMGKIIDKNYNDVIEDAEAQQEAFNKKVKEYEAEKDRLKKEKEEAKQRVWLERSAKLTALNALYSDDHFMLGDARVKKDMVTGLDDAVFAEVLKGFQEAHDKIEEERRQEEERKRQEADELRQQQEELKRQKEEFEKQQQQLKEQQEALQRQQEELARQERQRQEEAERKERWEKAEAERKKEEATAELIRTRFSQLDDAYWSVDGEKVQYNYTTVIAKNELAHWHDDIFIPLRDAHNSRVAEDRAEAEKIRQQEAETQRLEKELDDMVARREAQLATIGVPFPANLREMTDPEYASFYTAEFESFEKKKHGEWLENERVKKMQEQEREKERLADLSENKRWREWVEKKLIPFMADIPTFESKRYVRARAIAAEKIEEIISLKPGNF